MVKSDDSCTDVKHNDKSRLPWGPTTLLTSAPRPSILGRAVGEETWTCRGCRFASCCL